jgi:hypothetical protein
VNTLVFLGGEYVGADRKIVVVAVDKLEGKHEESCWAGAVVGSQAN